jgi:hypothetical protein
MGRSLFIGFLIAHGLVHLAIWLVPKPSDQKAPFDPDHPWCWSAREPREGQHPHVWEVSEHASSEPSTSPGGPGQVPTSVGTIDP